jgi:tetratricopeptide (TPR) repeat protein
MKYYFLLISLFAAFAFASCGNSGSNNDGDIPMDSIPADMREISERINEDPDNAALYQERALMWMQKKDFDKAMRDVNRAIANDIDNPKHFILKSDIFFAMGKVNDCKESLLKAMEKDENDTEAILKYAELHFFLQDYETMFLYIDRTLEVDKLNPKAYFMRGMALKEVGDTAKAISNMQTAVEQDPYYYDAYVQLGVLFDYMDNPLALQYYQNALSVDTNSLEVRYNMAMYYQRHEEFNIALELYFDIIKKDPNYKFAYYNLGYIHLVYLEVYTESVKYFTKAIAIDPNYVEAYYNRGYAYELRGDITNARMDYEMALQLRTNYPLAIEGLNRLDN